MRAIHLLAVLALAASAACAHAPGRPRDPDAAREAAFESAALVFTGELFSSTVDIDSVLSNRRNGYRIKRLWKGRAADTVTVWERPDRCPLGLRALGDEYIVYAARDSVPRDAMWCSRIVPVDSASAAGELEFLHGRTSPGSR